MEEKLTKDRKDDSSRGGLQWSFKSEDDFAMEEEEDLEDPIYSPTRKRLCMWDMKYNTPKKQEEPKDGHNCNGWDSKMYSEQEEPVVIDL